MPNQYQTSFLLAFLATLAVLVGVAYSVQTQLKAAGYDISRLILIGLPTNDTNADMSSASALTVAGLPAAQVGALVLAVVTSALLYVKFGAKSKHRAGFD